MIKLIISIAFAGESDLGWDPTMKSGYEGNDRVFDFEVSGRHFKTSESDMISIYNNSNIFSKGSRIFKAFDVEDKDKKYPLILKDHWYYDLNDSEADIQKMILEDIIDPDEREIFKRSTMTVVASGRVQVGGRDDHTRDTILRGVFPRRAYKITPTNGYKGERSEYTLLKRNKFWLEACGVPSLLKQCLIKLRKRGMMIHQYHHRVVYKEVAIPYHKLRNLEDMVLVLKHSIEGTDINH